MTAGMSCYCKVTQANSNGLTALNSAAVAYHPPASASELLTNPHSDSSNSLLCSRPLHHVQPAGSISALNDEPTKRTKMKPAWQMFAINAVT